MAVLSDMPLCEADDFDASGLGDDATVFVESLRRDGVAAIDLRHEARMFCDEADTQTDPHFTDGSARWMQDAWCRSPVVRRVANLPPIHKRLAAAYGRSSFPLQTVNFQRGTEQKLHSDPIHFSSLSERFMCGVWIVLEDIQPVSDPLAYVPDSHRLSKVTMRDAGVNRRSRESYCAAFVERFADTIALSNLPRRELTVSEGWAFVWAANLTQGGSPIEDANSTRRPLIVHHYFENCLYFTPLLSDTERSRLAVRLPANIDTGGFRWPMRDERAALPSLGTALGTIVRHMLRQPYVQR